MSTLLQSLTLTTVSITAAMMFCFKHSYAAPSIVGMICKEGGFIETNNENTDDEEDEDEGPLLKHCPTKTLVPAPKQIACLYLMSDLLSNSSCSKQGASMYRSSIEELLTTIMCQLRKTHINILGRITAGAMSSRIQKVLNVWETWGVFTTRFVQELRQIFAVGPIAAAKSAKSSEWNCPAQASCRKERPYFGGE